MLNHIPIHNLCKHFQCILYRFLHILYRLHHLQSNLVRIMCRIKSRITDNFQNTFYIPYSQYKIYHDNSSIHLINYFHRFYKSNGILYIYHHQDRNNLSNKCMSLGFHTYHIPTNILQQLLPKLRNIHYHHWLLGHKIHLFRILQQGINIFHFIQNKHILQSRTHKCWDHLHYSNHS